MYEAYFLQQLVKVVESRPSCRGSHCCYKERGHMTSSVFHSKFGRGRRASRTRRPLFDLTEEASSGFRRRNSNRINSLPLPEATNHTRHKTLLVVLAFLLLLPLDTPNSRLLTITGRHYRETARNDEKWVDL